MTIVKEHFMGIDVSKGLILFRSHNATQARMQILVSEIILVVHKILSSYHPQSPERIAIIPGIVLKFNRRCRSGRHTSDNDHFASSSLKRLCVLDQSAGSVL